MHKSLIVLFISLVAVTVLLGFSSGLHMPETPVMILISLALALSLWVVLYGYRAKAKDEREYIHLNRSHFWANLVGSVILIIAAIWQLVMHSLDLWLIYALSGMAAARLLAHWYLDRNN